MERKRVEDGLALDRRDFLKAGLSAGALLGTGAGLGGCAKGPVGEETEVPQPEKAAVALPSGLDPADFIVHSTQPLNLETPRSAFGTRAITPNHRMYVRANLPLPPTEILEDRDAWRISVSGVRDPSELTLGELKTLDTETVAAVVQCSGNGRYWFEHGPSGSPWSVGAAANVIWTGAPVRAVVDELGGAEPGMRYLNATGGEPIPEGVEERQVAVERSIPIEKATKDCLLTWEMNGEPIPLVYGGPLRLIVPGYYGINQVKYLKRLAFAAAESDARIQRASYRMRPIGEKGAPEQPSMWAMNVKSWITSPLGETPIPAGRVRAVGVAFAGENRVEQVEISTDGGATWERTEFFGLDFGPYGWRQFQYGFDAPPGEYHLVSRATDVAGRVQPEHRVENHRGYGNNSWRDHSVRITVRT